MLRAENKFNARIIGYLKLITNNKLLDNSSRHQIFSHKLYKSFVSTLKIMEKLIYDSIVK